MYQVLEGKCEPGETVRQGAVHEMYEEMGIKLKLRRLKFITYDLKFDCNIYAYKIQHRMLELKEL